MLSAAVVIGALSINIQRKFQVCDLDFDCSNMVNGHDCIHPVVILTSYQLHVRQTTKTTQHNANVDKLS